MTTGARWWAEFRVRVAEQGCTSVVNDRWIAAVTMANGKDDHDFETIVGAAGPSVIRV